MDIIIQYHSGQCTLFMWEDDTHLFNALVKENGGVRVLATHKNTFKDKDEALTASLSVDKELHERLRQLRKEKKSSIT